MSNNKHKELCIQTIKDYFVKAFEEELDTNLYIVTSDKNEKETMATLEMAAKYSTADTDLDIEVGIAEYDEYYEEIINNPECGLYKFEQYGDILPRLIEVGASSC